MQFFKSILAVTALASFALADNTITFVSQDATNRSIVFTPQAGISQIETVHLAGYESKVIDFPSGWVGNFFAMNVGDDPTHTGMLGEFTWNAWGGLTFFDVSAIVNPNDVNGIKEIFPKNANEPMAGCQDFPCNNAYNVWNDDVATKSTMETDFVCLIGTLASQRRRGARSDASEHMKRVTPLTGEVSAKL